MSKILRNFAYGLNPGDDSPDFVILLAKAIASREVERGIAICGSGVGANFSANKVPDVRSSMRVILLSRALKMMI